MGVAFGDAATGAGMGLKLARPPHRGYETVVTRPGTSEARGASCFLARRAMEGAVAGFVAGLLWPPESWAREVRGATPPHTPRGAGAPDVPVTVRVIRGLVAVIPGVVPGLEEGL